MKKRNYLENDFFDFNVIEDGNNFLTNPLNRKKFFLNFFKPKTDIYGTLLSKEDYKKRKTQIAIVCILSLFALSSIAGGTIAILKAQEVSNKKPPIVLIKNK
ncbi:MAG: hypothetical protein RSA40_01875 [Malacoplasma sp.]